MEELIDKTIKNIFVDKESQSYLRFITDKGALDYSAEGECCSESYFSDINRIKNIIGKKIEAIVEVELMPEEITPIESRQDEDTIYGFKLLTNGGSGLIVMRNSSNGYYGGEVIRIDKIPEKEEMFEIVRDFCALDLIQEKSAKK